jgi:heme o synthase
MPPVTHCVEITSRYIVLYTILFGAVTVLPYLTRMSGVVYLGGAIVLNILFVRRAIAPQEKPSADAAMRTFRYSINYLMLLFTIPPIDHYWQPI